MILMAGRYAHLILMCKFSLIKCNQELTVDYEVTTHELVE